MQFRNLPAAGRKRHDVSIAQSATLFVIAVCCTLVALEAWSGFKGRALRIEEAETTTANLAHALARHANDLLRTTDVVLIDMQERVELPDGLQGAAAERLRQVLTRRDAQLPFLQRLFVLDEHGRQIMDSGGSAPAKNLSQIAYFEFHRTHRGHSVYVGPVLRAPSTGEWTFTLTRRVNHPDGSFAGVVVAALDVSYFVQFYNSFDIGKDGVIVLALADGTLLVRRPFITAEIGRQLSGSDLWSLDQPLPGAGHTEGVSPIDGVPRLLSYMRVADYPLVVFAGLSRDEVLAGWWQGAYMRSLGVLLLAAALAFLGARLVRQIRIRTRAEQALRDSQEELKFSATVYRALGEAIMVMDSAARIVAVNPAFTGFTGIGDHEVLGRRLDEVLEPGPAQPDFARQIALQLETTGHWHGQVRLLCRQGEDCATSWMTIDTIYDERDQVRQRVGMLSKLTDHKLAEQTIWQQANFDTLTGLPNRSMFQDRLAQEIKKARRTAQTLALLFIDLDRFKDVNDTLGHQVGDTLLKEAARRLLSCVRDADTVARLGGDEFTVILSQIDSVDAASIAQAILQRLAEPFALCGELAFISASIGITHYPADGEHSEVLVKNADQAMYAAKNEGRNRYKFFTARMQNAAQHRLRMVSDLRNALAEGQFRMVYQPIVTLADGAVAKAEALIRWEHPRRGLISPAEFIPLAEETGLIVEIGNWVFAEVAQQVQDWRQRQAIDVQVSVNLSPAQLRADPGLHGSWLNTLHSLGLPGPCIAIEITEGMLMEDSRAITDELHRFRSAGMQVSLDDFGTGYSSLSYLKKFDIDTLKIDQSFVRNMIPGSDDLALCEAIIVMAHKLGITVVAEGVETREQRNMLVAAGCDFGQGYFFSRPLSSEKFSALSLAH